MTSEKGCPIGCVEGRLLSLVSQPLADLILWSSELRPSALRPGTLPGPTGSIPNNVCPTSAVPGSVAVAGLIVSGETREPAGLAADETPLLSLSLVLE